MPAKANPAFAVAAVFGDLSFIVYDNRNIKTAIFFIDISLEMPFFSFITLPHIAFPCLLYKLF